MKFFKSIRTRLTLWYLGFIVVLLLIFSSVAYLMLYYNLYNNLDNSLQARIAQLNTPTGIIPKSNEVILSFNANGTLAGETGGVTVDTSKLNGLVKEVMEGQNAYLTTVTTKNEGVRLYATAFYNPLSGEPAVWAIGQLT
ncbi:MAG: hypothetical protein WBQ62_07025, partial [Dehalococcoidales bacterium]